MYAYVYIHIYTYTSLSFFQVYRVAGAMPGAQPQTPQVFAANGLSTRTDVPPISNVRTTHNHKHSLAKSPPHYGHQVWTSILLQWVVRRPQPPCPEGKALHTTLRNIPRCAQMDPTASAAIGLSRCTALLAVLRVHPRTIHQHAQISGGARSD